MAIQDGIRIRPVSRFAVFLAVFLLIGFTFGLFIVASAATDTRSDVNVTVYRSDNLSGTDATSIDTAIGDNVLESASEIAVGDTLVVVIESERLAATMAASNGSNTQRFFFALQGDAAFRLLQTNPTAQANRKIAPVGPENTTVHRQNATIFVLIETQHIDYKYRKVNRPAEIHGGERFAVEFGYDLDDPDDRSDFQPAGPVVEFYPSRAEFSTVSARVWYDPLPPEWVQRTVEVNLDPADALSVRVALETNRTIEVPIDPNEVPSLHDIWLDLRGVPPGTEYRLELVFDGRTVDQYNGTVREPTGRILNATLAQVDNQTVVNATVWLSHGGEVAVRNEACEVVGYEFVEPDTRQQVTIKLWDEDGHEIRADPAAGYAVLVRAKREGGASKALYPGPNATRKLGFNGSCTAPEVSETPVRTRSPTSTPNSSTLTADIDTFGSKTRTITPDTGPTQEHRSDSRTAAPGQPGFTVITVLVALILLASAGWRQR